MKRIDYSVRVLCFIAVFLVGRLGECQSTLQLVFFKVGEFKDYKVVCPKVGFKGAPTSPSATPDRRRPEGDEALAKRFIRVTVLAMSEQDNGQRAVLRIDETDTKGDVLINGLYYTYVDILPQGSRVVCRYTNDSQGDDEIGVRYGVPFPLTCARPPALGFKTGKKDGNVNAIGLGVEYVQKDEKALSGLITVEATHFERLTGLEEKALARPIWYGGDIEDVKNDARTKVHFREKQRWGKANDWLWNEMERVDKDGNLLMHCTKK